MVKISGRFTIPWMRRRCCSGSMSGTPLWCRSKWSPLGVTIRSSASNGEREAPLPVVPGWERINSRVTLLSYLAGTPYPLSGLPGYCIDGGTSAWANPWRLECEATGRSQRRQATAEEDPSVEQSVPVGGRNRRSSWRRALCSFHIALLSLAQRTFHSIRIPYTLASTGLANSSGPLKGASRPHVSGNINALRRRAPARGPIPVTLSPRLGHQPGALERIRCPSVQSLLVLRSLPPRESGDS